MTRHWLLSIFKMILTLTRNMLVERGTTRTDIQTKHYDHYLSALQVSYDEETRKLTINNGVFSL